MTLLIETQRDALHTPLQAVTGVVERKNTLPILSNVLLIREGEALSFVATDLELEITTRAVADGPGQDFAITVAARKLQDICRALPDSAVVKLESRDGQVEVRAGRSKFSLQALPAKDYPRMQEQPGAEVREIALPQGALKRVIGLVQYAMAQQDIRYDLNGMLLALEAEEIAVVGTDGHRLSYAALAYKNEGEPREVIVPRKTVQELYKLLADSDEPVTIRVGQGSVEFVFGSVVMKSKLVDYKYPDYRRVIPTGYTRILKLKRAELGAALQRASILSNEKFRGVRLQLTQDSLKVLCTNNEQEEAEEELEISYSGEALDMGFNVTYLLDGLNHVGGEEVLFALGDANSSLLMTAESEPGFKYVVMPMRI
jgi:DNA polymerase-3 subunit beta